jgi:hypothetical protein
MIINFHPDESSIKENFKFIGFWRDTKGSISKLPWPDDFVDKKWNEEEKELVAAYLDAGKKVGFWKGSSSCRLGCKNNYFYKSNLEIGSTDQSDGEWVWPEGFSHYIKVHNVKPPIDFINKIIEKSRQDGV